MAITGPSGCGKSTLLRLLAGLEIPDQGTISQTSEHIGFVFQESNLLPWKTVLENVLLPFELNSSFKSLSFEKRKNRALQVLSQVKLSESKNLFPHQLSGGMKMRVALARALVTDPPLLLLDEPFAALDEFTRAELQHQLRDLWQSSQRTIVFVTHSLTEACYLSERIIMLSSPGAKIIYDHILDLPKQRTETLKTSEPFNKIVRELSGRIRS